MRETRSRRVNGLVECHPVPVSSSPGRRNSLLSPISPYWLLGLMSTSKHSRTPSTHTQASLSSYFSQSQGATGSGSQPPKATQSKRAPSPIDLTLDSDDEAAVRPQKRQKTASGFFARGRPNATPTKQASASSRRAPDSGGQAEQWRFDPSSPTKTARSPGDAEKQRQAHERAKRILLGNSGVFRRKTPSAEAPASSDVEFEIQDDVLPQIQEDEHEETDKKFGELMSMFASSTTKKKGKATAKTSVSEPAPSRSRAKKAEEIGPSGQPYTPFESQVCSWSVPSGHLLTVH